jgi:hypothetical protein
MYQILPPFIPISKQNFHSTDWRRGILYFLLRLTLFVTDIGSVSLRRHPVQTGRRRYRQ